VCLLGVVGSKERRDEGRAFRGSGIKSRRRCLGAGAEGKGLYVRL